MVDLLLKTNDLFQELMKSMATLSHGVYMGPEDIPKLCGYFMVQVRQVAAVSHYICSALTHSGASTERMATQPLIN